MLEWITKREYKYKLVEGALAIRYYQRTVFARKQRPWKMEECDYISIYFIIKSLQKSHQVGDFLEMSLSIASYQLKEIIDNTIAEFEKKQT